MDFGELEKNRLNKGDAGQRFNYAMAAFETALLTATSRERGEGRRFRHVWIVVVMVFFVIFFNLVYVKKPAGTVNAQVKNVAGVADKITEKLEISLDIVEKVSAEEPETASQEEEVGENSSEKKTEWEIKRKPGKKSQKKPVSDEKETSGFIAPGVVAKRPNTYREDYSGRLVCEKENDDPGISDQNKPVHIDMECCLDVDEIPNPFCYYPPNLYGAIIADYEKNKEKMIKKHLANKKL